MAKMGDILMALALVAVPAGPAGRLMGALVEAGTR